MFSNAFSALQKVGKTLAKQQITNPSATNSSSANATAVEPWVRESAKRLLTALGGKANVRGLQAIAYTRLRVVLADSARFDALSAGKAGALGIMRVDTNTYHLIVGRYAGQFAAAMT